MLDSIVKLLERLIKFGEVREANRQKYIDRYAAPTMQAAEVIYRDYLNLLHLTRKKVKTFKKVLPLLQFLEERRLEQLPLRVRIRAVMRETPQSRRTKFEVGIMGLMNGCLSQHESHFFIHPIQSGPSGHTVYDLISRVEDIGDRPILESRERLLKQVERQIEALNKAWEYVCAGFAELSTIAIPEPPIPKKFQYPNNGD